jgi:hypothetical protein
MLFERQRLLLALTDALGGTVAHTDFQKLLFLYTKDWEADPSYDFVPYQFGCFSFTSYADKRRLIERGLLLEDDHRWILTDAGRVILRKGKPLSARTARFAAVHAKFRGDALIAETYRRHPYYATRSKVAERVLPERIDRVAIAAAKPVARGAGLVTIGYEGRSLEAYLNLLLQDTVSVLCDVRRNPLSRKFGFAKNTLRSACEGVGIRYEHLPELGIASEDRRELETQSDYEELFADYERNSLPHQTYALEKIFGWINREGHRVALTCYEAEPCQCHRHCVAEALDRLGGGRLPPHHL